MAARHEGGVRHLVSRWGSQLNHDSGRAFVCEHRHWRGQHASLHPQTGGTELDVLFHIIFILGPPEKEIFRAGQAEICENYDEIVADYEKSSDKTGQCIRNSMPRAESALVDFVEKCLNWDKDLRPSADEALSHYWIKGIS